MQIDDPIHEVEANEGDWEKYPGILVNVRRRNAHHFLEVLFALNLLGPGRRPVLLRGRWSHGIVVLVGLHARPVVVQVVHAWARSRARGAGSLVVVKCDVSHHMV